MMSDAGVGIIAGAVVAAAVVYALTGMHTERRVMHEAFKHGKDTLCLGKEGYHFTCEDDK